MSISIVYTCPECGGDLEELVLTSYPPIYQKKCPKCGWSYEEQDEVIRVPFNPFNKTSETAFTNEACTNCSNNPANGGSGICNCILGLSTVY